MASKVAIVGIGCRFPGANDIEEFWEVLKNGENHVIEVPKNRWNLDAFYHRDAGIPGKTNVRKAGFVQGCERWDYKVYGINEFESLRMDPQHKLVLDSTFMALESAGITRKEIRGSNTGVYIGIMNSDYSDNFAISTLDFDNYTVTGTNASIVSSRVNYVFDLRGPSMTIDTACSSSLIAIHNAHQAILSGECEMAIAGGANSLLKPDVFIQLSKAGMLSPTGQCQAFSKNADGYARGEGSGIVILKSYDKAVEDNNPIWATISTASNHDGHAVSPITTPSMEQQIQLLDTVFNRFHIDPQSIDYIEAHGTGTKAGDPVEVRALGTFFQTNLNSTPKLIGSVKTNIGHLESAAGVAGLIKVILMHRYEQIVPTLHFETPSPAVPLEEFRFTVPVKTRPWPENDKDEMRSSVNSFSFGGSNCHAIVTTTKSKPSQIHSTQINKKIVCISAIDNESLQMNKESICKRAKGFHLVDLSYTSIHRRDHYDCRLAVTGHTTAGVLQTLEGIDIDNHMMKYNPAKGKKLIFIFAGLGTNWKGMCQEMLKSFTVFRSTIEDISSYLQEYVTWDLFENLQNGFDLKDANITPIMTFACEVALFVLLDSFGVHPDSIIGQSIGEVAAAFASGAVTLKQAVHIIYHRTTVQVQGTGGKMFVAKNIEIDQIETVLKKYETQANISVYSSPMSCTISCDEEVVGKLKDDIKNVHTDCIFIDLSVTSAFHSHHMTNSEKQMRSCTEIAGGEPKIDIFSTVRGIKAVKGDFITAQYWADNIRKPVKLYQAVFEAYDPTKYNVFVEIGPRPILGAHLPNIFPDQVLFSSVPLMTKNDELDCITEAVCNFYNHGVDLKWKNFDKSRATVVDYPKYQFNRVDNLFIPMPATENLLGVDQLSKYHPIVKQLVSDPKDIKVLIEPSKLSSIYEHKVNGLVTIPGATYAEVGLALAALKSSSISFREVTVDFKTPLLIFNRESKQLDIKVAEHDGRTEFTVCRGSHVYCEGNITNCFNKPVPVINVESIQQRCTVHKTGEEIYADLGKLGFSYGTAMSILVNSVRNDREALVELSMNDLLWEEINGMILHPAVIDSLLQASGALALSDKDLLLPLPVQISKLRVYGGIKRKMFIHIEAKQTSSKTKKRYKLLLFSTIGEPIASIETFTAKLIGRQENDPQKMFFEPSWSLISHDLYDAELLSDKYVSVSVTPRQVRNEEVNVVVPLTDYRYRNRYIELLKETLCDYRYVALCIDVEYDENYGGKEIQKVVTDYLLWLKVVLECINDINEKHDSIRVLVTFKNTWRIDEMNSKSTIMIPDNILHSSLWGGMRSVQRELPTLATHIVDLHNIDGASDSHLLSIVVDKLSSDWQFNGELIVTTEGVFSYHIRYMATSGRMNYLSTNDIGEADFELFSTSESEVKDVFRLYARNASLHEQTGSVLINVTKWIFQDASLFMPIFSADQDEAGVDGWPVYCVETIGHQSNKPNDVLVSCFPVPASNRVRVPMACCMPLSSIPFYKPGMLSILVSLWTLASSIKTTRVILLQGKESSMYVYLLLLILQHKKVKCRLLNPEQFSSRTSNLKEREMICLIHLDKSLADMITSNSSIKRITLFSSLLPVPLALLLRTGLRQLTLHRIDEHDIFLQNNVDIAIQGILKWINKSGNTVQNVINQFDGSLNSQDPLHKLFTVTQMDHCYPNSANVPIRLTPDRLLSRSGAYIVVGGLTGLGWQCVQWLATHQAGYILIFNRRKPNTEDVRLIEDLSKSCSCTIECYSVDVVNLGSVTEAISLFTKTYSGVAMKGVFHGAGVTRDSYLFKMTEKQMEECFNPKILGAWNLHLATKHMNLDFFILHSSITAMLGAPGQSNYGVANAFQDSLIAVRRQLDLPIQTLNWGPLDMGMLKKGKENNRTRKILSSIGYNFIEKDEIGICLETVILFHKQQIMITKFDVAKLREVIDSSADHITKCRLRHILPKGNTEHRESEPFPLQTLKDADAKDKPKIIEAYILKLVRRILSQADQMIAPTTHLSEVGMDSMLAMTLLNQVNKDLSVKIPVNLIFDPETTALTLSRYIGKEHSTDDTRVTRLDNQIDVSKGAISFPELRYLQLDELPTFRAYHNVVDLYFGNLRLSKDIISNIIKTLVIRNPICTAVFEWSEDSIPDRADVKKYFLDIESALDICEVEPDDPNIEEIFHQRQFEKFYKRFKATVRFTFVVYEDSTRLAFVFNHVGFDLMAINLFLRDFVKCLGHVQQNLPLESFQKPQASEHQRSVCQTLDMIFNQQSHDLIEFWTDQIKRGVPRVTLDVYRDFHPKNKEADVCERLLPPETQRLCELLAKSMNTSTFRLYITIYQLLLSIRSQSERVFVITTVDLRQYSAQLLNRVECISNHIPIFADIPESNTPFKHFLKTNTEAIIKTIEHGMFPFTEFVKLIPDGENKDIQRHEMRLNDVSFANELNQVALGDALDVKIRGENPYTGIESEMKVLVDEIALTTKFRLMLGGDQYDQHDANEFMGEYMMMLHDVASCPNVTIQQLQDKFKPKLTGLFKKRSWTGLSDVMVCVDTDAKTIHIGRRSINFKNIKNVYITQDKDRYELVIESTSKSHRMIYYNDDRSSLLVNVVLHLSACHHFG